MRHVTDGELHTYLDGELDLLPGERGAEIRNHLSQCSVCRERLQDEEQVRAQAGQILEDPGLAAVPMPSLEELRERAAAGGPRPAIRRGEDQEVGRRVRSPLTGVPLAWAATVVLALGVGWVGSGVWNTVAEDSVAGAPSRVREARVSEGLEAGRAGDAELAVYEPPTLGRSDAVSDSTAPRATAQESQEAEPSPLPTAGPASAVSLRLAEDLTKPTAQAEERARAEPDSEDVTVRMSKATVPEVQGELDFDIRTRAAESSLLNRVERSAGAEPGSEAGESALAVPGLEVVSVQWEERVPGELALHVRQLLPAGDTLELRYLGMLLGMDPGQRREAIRNDAAGVGVSETPPSPQVLKASLPPGWNQVVMRWGRGWLVARAPLSEASLKALLKSLR